MILISTEGVVLEGFIHPVRVPKNRLDKNGASVIATIDNLTGTIRKDVSEFQASEERRKRIEAIEARLAAIRKTTRYKEAKRKSDLAEQRLSRLSKEEIKLQYKYSSGLEAYKRALEDAEGFAAS